MTRTALHIVFTGPPGPEGGKFVEVETPDGRSANVGEWHDRADGLVELRIPVPSSPLVIDSKPVFVAWTNTDCTEGRGQQVPLAVCEAEATALRKGHRGSVQGSDCSITKSIAVRVEGQTGWFAPARIHAPTREDEGVERSLEAKRAAAQAKREAIERARAAGMSDADIKLLEG
jgi:hypothetical protein